jgi:hypothetical protein
MIAMSMAGSFWVSSVSTGQNQNMHFLRNRQPLLDEFHHDSSVAAMTRILQETNETMPACTLECCAANYEQDICVEDSGWISAVPVVVQILLTILLLSLSAIFSGLTLGLMSLDITGLEIVMAGDDPKQAEYAKNIYPVRKKGNLLLCTLLLGNVAVNSLLSIIMASFTSGTVGFLTSTILIVIFGEILPQALVSVDAHG